MQNPRNRKLMGVGLIVVGLLFLLVSNHILLGWEHVWPLFLLVGGVFLLRVFRKRRTGEMLFAGVSSVLLGVFLFLFSANMVDWDRMAVLWPAIPLIAGTALVVTSIMTHQGGPALVVGSGAVLFAALMFFLESDAVSTRVATPVIRFWPLVLILAGAIMLRLRPKDEPAEDPGMRAVRDVMDAGETAAAATDAGPSPGGDVARAGERHPAIRRGGHDDTLRESVMRRVESARNPASATFEFVQALRTNVSRYVWVGVYRLHGDTLRVADGEFAGAAPEYREIPLDSGICGAAATSRETIVAPDVCNDPRYLACDPSVKSEIAVPIIDEGELVGVLDVDSSQLDAFDDEDRAFLESLVRDVTPHIRAASAV